MSVRPDRFGPHPDHIAPPALGIVEVCIRDGDQHRAGAGDGVGVGRLRRVHDVSHFSECALPVGARHGCVARAFVPALADVLAADRAAGVGADVDLACVSEGPEMLFSQSFVQPQFSYV